MTKQEKYELEMGEVIEEYEVEQKAGRVDEPEEPLPPREPKEKKQPQPRPLTKEERRLGMKSHETQDNLFKQLSRLHPEWATMRVIDAVDLQLWEDGLLKKKPLPRWKGAAKQQRIEQEKKETQWVTPDAGQEDMRDFDFPDLYLTQRKLRKFASERNIPYISVKTLIDERKLRFKVFPNYHYPRFSTRQLGVLLRQYNKLDRVQQ